LTFSRLGLRGTIDGGMLADTQGFAYRGCSCAAAPANKLGRVGSAAFFAWRPGVLDRPGYAAYIAAHDDALGRIETPPPPCPHGTGALSRLIVSRAAGF
jgi:hypothetical protein